MRVGFLITARLKSTRLPRKILLPLEGRSVVERIIDRTKVVEGVDDIILCTSTEAQDRPLLDVCISNGVYYFTGDPEDVLARLLAAMRLFDLDYFIGITADNPVFSIPLSRSIVQEARTGRYDFIYAEGMPIGTATYAVRREALETICFTKTIVDTEIWGYLIKRPELFSLKSVDVDPSWIRDGLRLTLDYPEDYEFFKDVHEAIPFQDILPMTDVLEHIDAHPEVLDVNSACIQRDLDPELKSEIDRVYTERAEEIREVKDRIYSARGNQDMTS